MPSTNQPQHPFIDLVYQAVVEAMGNGNIAIRNFPLLQSVAVTNFPAIQTIGGTVAVNNFPATQAVTGAFFPATQQVAGSLGINNWPSLQNVAVVNFPAIQTVLGTVVLGVTPSTTPVTFSPGYTTSTSAPVTVPLTTVSTLVKSVLLVALKNTGAKNAAPVFIGTSGVATNQPIPLLPGASMTKVAEDGKMLDLSQIYVRITAINDGVSWLGSK